ncbi:MAG: hypothetical protein ABI629_08505 [bacterium]
MKRLRRQCAPLVPWVAALFTLVLAAPRAPLVFHTHAGGEHAHVHDDADLLAAFGFGDRQTHEHQQPRDGRAHFERPGAAADGHYHQQQRLQRGTLPAAVFVTVSAPLIDFTAPAPALAPERAPTAAKSRGPPLSLPS